MQKGEACASPFCICGRFLRSNGSWRSRTQPRALISKHFEEMIASGTKVAERQYHWLRAVAAQQMPAEKLLDDMLVQSIYWNVLTDHPVAATASVPAPHLIAERLATIRQACGRMLS